jgi:hypothetical protein
VFIRTLLRLPAAEPGRSRLNLTERRNMAFPDAAGPQRAAPALLVDPARSWLLGWPKGH